MKNLFKHKSEDVQYALNEKISIFMEWNAATRNTLKTRHVLD
jgi:hypothetical protein